MLALILSAHIGTVGVLTPDLLLITDVLEIKCVRNAFLLPGQCVVQIEQKVQKLIIGIGRYAAQELRDLAPLPGRDRVFGALA